MSESIKTIQIQRSEGETVHSLADTISIEEPLEIRISQGVKSQPVSVTMRTPGKDEELALGFLFTEGILNVADSIDEIRKVDANVVEVSIRSGITLNLESLSRNFYTTSSCGVCGKTSLDAIRVRVSQNKSDFSISKDVLLTLPAITRQAQVDFETTGGLHASTLFDASGKLLVTREDVGRHNALDKVIGSQLQTKKMSVSETILLVSGRASFELVQKAAVAGIPIMAAIGAPSSLAVELAKECGICLIGFLKADRFNIYSHPQRIKLS